MSDKGFKDYNLSEDITKALSSLGYEKPTEVQIRVIPLVKDGKDLIVRSQTGSGKTASFAIPICEMVDWMENKPQALVLTPTRELAVQVKEDFTNIGRLKRLKAAAVYGRQPIAIQINELKQKNHVVVGTPGRILDHIERGTIPLSIINYLVIDEADEMLRMGFIEQVEKIIEILPSKRITMLFSATMPDKVVNLAQRFMKDPVEIAMEDEHIAVDRIDHFLYPVSEMNKTAVLQDIIITENPDSCLIFCSTKDGVDQLQEQLNKQSYRCGKIHGGLEQRDRLKVIDSFKKGLFRYLIATDIAARGIDVENISLIINYDIPAEKEAYVHRTGRTGRAGLSGKAISLMMKRDERYVREIEDYIGSTITVLSPPSKEEVEEKRAAFLEKMRQEPILKRPRSEQLNREIMKLRINGGKNKKLRATNFVGLISNLEGVSAEDIGIISILDSLTYIEILNGKGSIVLEAMKTTPVGGRLLKVTEANRK